MPVSNSDGDTRWNPAPWLRVATCFTCHTVSLVRDSLLAVESKRRYSASRKKTKGPKVSQSHVMELFYACFGWFIHSLVQFFFWHLLMLILWFAVLSNTVPVLAASFNPYLWWSQYVLSMTYSDHISLVGGLEPWNFMTFHSVGFFSSSQLTNSLHHFSKGFVLPATRLLLTIINHTITININH